MRLIFDSNSEPIVCGDAQIFLLSGTGYTSYATGNMTSLSVTPFVPNLFSWVAIVSRTTNRYATQNAQVVKSKKK